MKNTLLQTLELAVEKHNEGQLHDAEKLYVEAIELDDSHPTAYYNLGLIYQEKGDDKSAELFFLKTKELNPSYVESCLQLAKLYEKHKLRELEKEQYEKALDLNSANKEIYRNLGRIYFEEYAFEQALTCLKKLFIVEPNNVELLSTMGSCYQQLNDVKQAKLFYEKALSLESGHINTLYNLSYIYLLQKDYIKGFDLYRYRYHESIRGHSLGGVAYPPTLLTPTDDIKAKTVYISHEQGLGDTIAFARFLPFFIQKGAKLLVYVPPSLKKLFALNYPEITFIATGSDISFDFNFPLMEAPYLLRTTFEEIPFCDKFLHVKTEDVASFRKNHHFSQKQKIGIIFKGSTAIKHRNIDLELLLSTLCMLPDTIELFSLQYDTTTQEQELLAKYGVTDLGKEIDNFYTTAIMIEAMDIMVSIDTSVLNLCGALGKTTLGLLNFTNLWRWVEDENSHAIWYKSITLLQQKSFNNWNDVLEVLNTKIEDMLCQIA